MLGVYLKFLQGLKVIKFLKKYISYAVNLSKCCRHLHIVFAIYLIGCTLLIGASFKAYYKMQDDIAMHREADRKRDTSKILAGFTSECKNPNTYILLMAFNNDTMHFYGISVYDKVRNVSFDYISSSYITEPQKMEYARPIRLPNAIYKDYILNASDGAIHEITIEEILSKFPELYEKIIVTDATVKSLDYMVAFNDDKPIFFLAIVKTSGLKGNIMCNGYKNDAIYTKFKSAFTDISNIYKGRLE